MKNKTGYLKEIKKVWELKKNVYEETKNKTYKAYTIAMNKDIELIKKRFKDKYITP